MTEMLEQFRINEDDIELARNFNDVELINFDEIDAHTDYQNEELDEICKSLETTQTSVFSTSKSLETLPNSTIDQKQISISQNIQKETIEMPHYNADSTYSNSSSQQSHQNQLQSSKNDGKTIKKRKHLNGERRRKGQRNKLQVLVEGYWTKNLLPFGKNHHFKWLQKKLTSQQYLQLFLKYQQLKAILEKNGITMEDYEYIYNIKELQGIWEELFASKVLYRQLMLSRTVANYRLIYVRFLHRFERAFRTKQFNGISRKLAEESANYL